MERYFLPLKIARPEGSASRHKHKNDAMESQQPMTEKELMIEELLAPPKPSLARRDRGCWGKAWGAYHLTGQLPAGMRADLQWRHLHSAFTQVAHYELPVTESSRGKAINEIRFDPKGEFVALGSSDGRIQLHDFARFEATMLPYYYNPPASKPQDVYRQETLFDGLSGRSYSVMSRDDAASSPMVPFDPPILTISTTHDVDTVQWSPWSDSELVAGFSSWQDIFAYDVAACKGSAPTRIIHNKNKNAGTCDLAFNKPRGLLVGISRNSSMQFWDLRAASDPVFASSPASSSSSSSASSCSFARSESTSSSPPPPLASSSSSQNRTGGTKRDRDAYASGAREGHAQDENSPSDNQAAQQQQQRAKRQRVDKNDFAEAMSNLLPRSAVVRKRGGSQQSAQEIERRRRQKEASRRFYLQPKQAFDLPQVRVRGNYSCLQVSDDGNMIYIGTETGDIQVYDFRKPMYALHTHNLGSYAVPGFTSRDAECGISSLVLDPHRSDRLYFHLSWNSISGLVDLRKGHEGLVAIYRPPATKPSMESGEVRRQPASTGTESLMATAPSYPYPNASRGRAALTADGACLCGGSYQEDGQYTVSIANMAACRIEEPDKPIIDLVAQHYDPPTAASIIARRKITAPKEDEERKRKQAVHIQTFAPVTCVATHPQQPYVLVGTTANRLLFASHQRQQF